MLLRLLRAYFGNYSISLNIDIYAYFAYIWKYLSACICKHVDSYACEYIHIDMFTVLGMYIAMAKSKILSHSDKKIFHEEYYLL